MAVVKGIKEKVHAPLYDSITVEGEKQLLDVESSSILKFFVNVQGKTKLETNLQSASQLPHYNTFEARAMRVVISDQPPEFPSDDAAQVEIDDEFTVEADNTIPGAAGVAQEGQVLSNAGNGTPATSDADALKATLTLTPQDLVDLLQEANDSDDGEAVISWDDDLVELKNLLAPVLPATTATNETILSNLGASIHLSVDDIEGFLDQFDTDAPADQQLPPDDQPGAVIRQIIFNTVTTFYVGEKIMIQLPTWSFPSGAGVWSAGGDAANHGEPTPLATFRFAEPIYIDKQQNFRVEIEVPDSDVLKNLQQLYGPFVIWVVLDGYMTRDVQ